MTGFDWIASVLALAGTFLLSRRAPSPERRRLAFILYLASNGLWIAWGLHAQAYAMVFMQLGFTWFSVDGIRNAIKDGSIEKPELARIG